MVKGQYSKVSLPRYKETLSLIYPYLNTHNHLRVLDFGTGEGDMAISIKQHFPQHEVVAADVLISEDVKRKLMRAGVHVCEQKLRIEPRRRLPIENDSFDAILFLEVLEHIIDEPMHVFSELHRILRSGGYLFLTTPNIATLFNRMMLLFGKQPQLYFSSLRCGFNLQRGHFREWAMDELLHILSHTFKVEKCVYLSSLGTRGLVKERKLYRVLYYPYRLLCAMKPSLRSTIAIISRK